MRKGVMFALMASSLVPAVSLVHAQAGATKTAIRACSLLTKELVIETTPYEKKVITQVLSIPPSEEPAGQSGSACSYGGVHLQVNPFPLSVIENQRQADARNGKPWAAVAGVGDVAYFRDNRGRFGELFTRAGAHIVTIQMDVPHGRTTESIKPNAVALAQALVAKLR